MSTHKLCALGASLVSAFFLSAANCALALEVGAQVGRTPLLGVNVNLPLINKTRVDANLGKSGALTGVTAPSVLGLPAVGAGVAVNTAVPAPTGVGVSLGSGQGGGTLPGIPPTAEIAAAAMAAVPQAQLAEKRIELLPTCR